MRALNCSKNIMPLMWMTWMSLLQCVFLFQILDTMPSSDELQARTMSPFGILSSSQETISTFLQVPLKKHASIFALCLVKCNKLASTKSNSILFAFLVSASKKVRQNNTQEETKNTWEFLQNEDFRNSIYLTSLSCMELETAKFPTKKKFFYFNSLQRVFK